MSQVLSQEEVDELLRGSGEEDFIALLFGGYDKVEDFEKHLLGKKFEPEKKYGIFAKDASVIKFFNDERGENILADIKAKNRAQGMGNIKIPGTSIELLNYSYCPKCGEIHSFMDLIEYYNNPVIDSQVDRATQLKRDTRACCKGCGEFFLPSLVISDGTPRQEVQHLCRVQTIAAIESFYKKKNRSTLSQNRSNLIFKNSKRGILNDINIKDISEKPTLVSNFLQYTPPDLMIPFIEGKNRQRGDLVYGSLF